MIGAYLDGRMTLGEFEAWYESRNWNVLPEPDRKNPKAVIIALHVKMGCAELREGRITEEQLRGGCVSRRRCRKREAPRG